MEEIIFNPIKDKSPSGTLKKGEIITFSFRIKQDLLIDKIMLVLRYEKTNFVYNLECKLSEYEVNYNAYKTSVKLDEAGLEIKDATGSSDESLLYAGYDEKLGETIVKSKNMTVEKYLVIRKIFENGRFYRF